jgi:hypothetical protein
MKTSSWIREVLVRIWIRIPDQWIMDPDLNAFALISSKIF